MSLKFSMFFFALCLLPTAVAPSYLTAGYVSTTTVILTWKYLNDISADTKYLFEIKYSMASYGILSKTANTTSATISSLHFGAVYNFTVAFIGNGADASVSSILVYTAQDSEFVSLSLVLLVLLNTVKSKQEIDVSDHTDLCVFLPIDRNKI